MEVVEIPWGSGAEEWQKAVEILWCSEGRSLPGGGGGDLGGLRGEEVVEI